MNATTRTQKNQEDKRGLPESWRRVKLGEVIREAQAGFACGERDENGVVQLRMNNIDTRGNFIWDDVLRVPREGKNIEPFLLVPGDVLFNNTNSTELVGKAAFFTGYAEPIVYSNHFTRLRTVNDGLLPAFLASWLNYQWQQGVFAAICNRWIGQSAVKADKLLNLQIPLPPLPEQQRIAGILKEQTAAVQKARSAAQARLAAIKDMPAAFLRQVFPQPGQSLPDGWWWVRLGEVVEIVSGQVDPKEAQYRDLKHVNGENIESGTGRLIEVRTAAEDQMTSGKYLFEAGVVLYSKLRPYLKKAVIADFRGLCSADMYPILPKPNDLIPSFLLQILLSEPFTRYAESQSQRARMPKLNRDQLLAYSAPLPPLAEQQRMAQLLKEQMAAVEKGRTAAETELNTINALPAALLHRAFSGEL